MAEKYFCAIAENETLRQHEQDERSKRKKGKKTLIKRKKQSIETGCIGNDGRWEDNIISIIYHAWRQGVNKA